MFMPPPFALLHDILISLQGICDIVKQVIRHKWISVALYLPLCQLQNVTWSAVLYYILCLFHQLQSIFNELEEQKELATSRFTELEKLQEKHQETISEMESLKLDVSFHFAIS